MPARSTAEMWTKTSGPPASGWMKPKPLVALNHLTVPVAINAIPSYCDVAVGKAKRPTVWYRDFGDGRQQTRLAWPLAQSAENFNTVHICMIGEKDKTRIAPAIP